MILLIDNYDSFTYNLYQAIGQLYEDITVIRNEDVYKRQTYVFQINYWNVNLLETKIKLI